MSTETGRVAEEAAIEWLKASKFQIITKNWRNRWCEIDIIAMQGSEIHFIEVKYRKTAAFGNGFEYITTNKSNRLKRAALFWLADQDNADAPYHIDVISVAGTQKPFTIEYLPDAIEG